MQLKTILNRVQKHSSLVYEEARFVEGAVPALAKFRSPPVRICSKTNFIGSGAGYANRWPPGTRGQPLNILSSANRSPMMVVPTGLAVRSMA